jgi:zinc D-Ala-D-Ala dipeptidase
MKVSKNPLAEQLARLAHLETPPLEEIRYATKYNFTGTRLYPFPIAFLHKDAAACVEKIQHYLATQGLGLKVWDGFRPLSVQQKMWDLIQDERYVSNPATNSGRHTRGTAIDVTLVDHRGCQLAMPTDYDDFSEKAHSDWAGASSLEKHHRELLQEAMTRFGFEVYPYEWWHFDLRNWKDYPPLDIDFSQIGSTWWLLARDPRAT